MDPFRASAALHSLAQPGHISSAHRAGKDGARVGMNVIAHQEKEENEETDKGKKTAGENRRLATDFKDAVCCPSAVVQGAARKKNKGEYPG